MRKKTKPKIVCSIDLFTPLVLPEIMVKAFAGDDDAGRTLEALAMAIDRIVKRPKYCLCFMCDTCFTDVGDVAAWSLLTPQKPDGVEEVIASGICHDCWVKPNLIERIIEQYKNTIAKGFEVHSIGGFPEPGHA